MKSRTHHPDIDTTTNPHHGPPSEDICLRNYDFDTAHTVSITIAARGEPIFQDTLRLSPGQAHSLTDTVRQGEYEITVNIDGCPRRVDRCQLGDQPEETVFIEIGNGVVSITQGFQ